jgi:hypothetical protein
MSNVSMNGLQLSIGLLALAVSGVVFAQDSDAKPPDPSAAVATSAAVASRMLTPIAPDPCASRSRFDQAEILTDTKGVDFAPYLTLIVKSVRQSWYKMISASSRPPISKKGRVSIEFVVEKDGKISPQRLTVPRAMPTWTAPPSRASTSWARSIHFQGSLVGSKSDYVFTISTI